MAEQVMSAQDYITQIKEELFNLEAGLEQAEYEADSLQRTIDEAARRREAIRVDAFVQGGELAEEFAYMGTRINNARLGQAEARANVAALEEHIRALRAAMRGHMRRERLGVRVG